MKKKRIVENDKSKILATIEDLDQKKNQAINIAWQKVFEPQNIIVYSVWGKDGRWHHVNSIVL